MDRTTASNYTTDASGNRIYRDKAGATPGTTLAADDRNQIQEEIVGIIEKFGLTPDALTSQVKEILYDLLGKILAGTDGNIVSIEDISLAGGVLSRGLNDSGIPTPDQSLKTSDDVEFVRVDTDDVYIKDTDATKNNHVRIGQDSVAEKFYLLPMPAGVEDWTKELHYDFATGKWVVDAPIQTDGGIVSVSSPEVEITDDTGGTGNIVHIRIDGTGTKFYLVPAPAGVDDFTKELHYQFDTEEWVVDAPLRGDGGYRPGHTWTIDETDTPIDQNTFFDRFSSYIPNTGDIMVLYGSARKTIDSEHAYIYSSMYLERDSSTTMVLRGTYVHKNTNLSSTDAYVLEKTITNGDTTTLFTTIRLAY